MPEAFERHRPQSDDDPPPFLGSWRNVYVAVVLYLTALILLFYLFRVTFSPAVAS